MGETDKAANASKIEGFHFPSWYDPNSPEVIERRRKLFANLEAQHSKEAEEAMDKLARESGINDDLD
jgi:hypothetical protein